MYRVWKFLEDYSLLLVIGAAAALLWANVSPESYRAFVHLQLWENAPIGHLHISAGGEAHRTLTFHYLVNDVLMALFFGMAGKEVWEAVALEGGSLRGLDNTGTQVFEPRDVHKGNVARAMLYMATRYSYTLTASELALYKSWNALDPVDAAELDRTWDIAAEQVLTNPYVVCPQYVDAL